MLLDPNTLRADGTAALAGSYPSRDGKLLAYGIADAGSDWTEWRVRDIDTGKDLPDVIRWSKFSQIEWTPGRQGLLLPALRRAETGRSDAGAERIRQAVPAPHR